MNTPDAELDKHLQALYGALDTTPDFDTRFRARLQAESERHATERAMAARQQERARYSREVSQLHRRRQSILRLLTLDALGIALLLTVALVAWPSLGRNALDISRQYGPYIAMWLSIPIAAVPLLGMWAERTHSRPINPYL